jgi:dsRNA-specific ribonuclease
MDAYLGRIAKEIELVDFMVLNHGLIKPQVTNTVTALAIAMEGIVGAIYFGYGVKLIDVNAAWSSRGLLPMRQNLSE